MSALADPARLAALAARWGLAPQEILVLAGRLALDADPVLTAARLQALAAQVRHAGAAAVGAATQLALGPCAHAFDDVDRMLASAWSAPRPAEAGSCAAPR